MDLNGFVNILLAEKQYVHSDVRGVAGVLRKHQGKVMLA
jgi:hypothetical protein